MDFKIEKGITLPPKKQGYPFHKMEVGDSFRVPPEFQKRVSAAAFHFGKSHGGKFSMRATRHEIRLWRIA